MNLNLSIRNVMLAVSTVLVVAQSSQAFIVAAPTTLQTVLKCELGQDQYFVVFSKGLSQETLKPVADVHVYSLTSTPSPQEGSADIDTYTRIRSLGRCEGGIRRTVNAANSITRESGGIKCGGETELKLKYTSGSSGGGASSGSALGTPTKRLMSGTFEGQPIESYCDAIQ